MLLFLDIDGVMIQNRSWQKSELLSDGFSMFNPKAIKALNSIMVSNDDLTVILTTSHKERYSIGEWKQIFANRGITLNGLEKLGNNTNNLSRKDEIINWFNTNECENFVIIDDDKSLNDLPPNLKNNLVQTSSLVGLTDSHLEEINYILSRNLELVS